MDFRLPLIDIFLAKNAQLNLSAIRDSEGVYTKHILDSLELTKILDLTQFASVCDVGTGGGFPLLALAKQLDSPTVKQSDSDTVESNSELLTPNSKLLTQFIGIDARRKKVDAINDMITDLGLTNCQAIRSRIEDHQHQYDIVTARAVAYADQIMPRCLPLCKKGGKICLYKQVDDVEREVIRRQCQQHSLVLITEHRYTLYDGDIQRVIYILQKK